MFDDVGCPQTSQLKSIIFISIYIYYEWDSTSRFPPNLSVSILCDRDSTSKAVPNPNRGSRSWMLGSRAMWLPGPGFFKEVWDDLFCLHILVVTGSDV